MFCESYRQPLMDSLAAGEPLPPELAKHLAGCSACTSAFAEERTLFAAIEYSLGVAVNVPAPPSLALRVRAQIVAGPAKASLRAPVLAFAALSLVAGVVAISPVFHWRSTPDDSRGKHSAVAPTVQSAAGRDAIGSFVHSTPPVRKASSKLRKVVVSQSKVRSDLEVLVSPEEQAGLEGYAARLRARALESTARAAVTNDPPFQIQPLEIAVMDSRQLIIEPLESDEYN
jgi:hypothetical protein